jgi:three-Cys-motif partner protein
MARYNGRIIFIDGFAGPGRYSGGEEGSPIIALKALLEHRYFKQPQREREVVLLFIEQDQARTAALQREVDEFKKAQAIPDWVKTDVRHGEFAPVMTELLDKVAKEGHRLAPTFVFIDPFGFAGVPMRVIARIVENPSCECLITFMYESVNRFLSHSDPAIQAHFDELFGTPEWKDVAAERDPEKRRDRIVVLYRRQLMEVARLPYVRTFEMINEGNRAEYFLYFGTRNQIGFSKMKESMWRADPVAGSIFSDLTDSRQEVLLEAGADLTRLRSVLQQRFRGRGAVPIEDVEEFVLKETPYSESIHLKRRTLAPMEQAKLVEAQVQAGRKRRRGTYPPGTLLIFL